jgi:predicted RNase H-like nuclease (RuvC/YqgF family)
MTLTAIVGALMALVPRPWKDGPFDRIDKNLDKLGSLAGQLDGEIERLTKENKQLKRSHARLIDHIQSLEREILIEQHLSVHWREEAERLARTKREAREAREAAIAKLADDRDMWRERARAPERGFQAQQLAQIGQQQAQALGQQQAQALGQQQAQALGQQQAQALGAQQQAQALGAQNQQTYGGFCNCVPSRAQAWAANRGE